MVTDYQEIFSNVEIPKINIVYKMSKKAFKNIEEANLHMDLRMIINANFGATSDFKEDLMEKELITGLDSRVDFEEDDIVNIIISCETKYPKELINMIKENMQNLDITKERLARRIKVNVAQYITSFDDIEYINSYIQDEILTFKKIHTDALDIYKNADLETIKSILKHINTDNIAIMVQLPQKKD